MSSPVLYARFLGDLRNLGGDSTMGLVDLLATDEILALILEGSSVKGGIVRVVDIVRTNRFGTPPTVIKRLQKLEADGLIESKVAEDRRARSLTLSKSGVARLRERSVVMRKLVLAEAV